MQAKNPPPRPITFLMVRPYVSLGSLSKRGDDDNIWEVTKIFRHNPCVFLGIYFLSLPCSVSSFAELQLLSVSLPKRKDRR